MTENTTRNARGYLYLLSIVLVSSGVWIGTGPPWGLIAAGTMIAFPVVLGWIR